MELLAKQKAANKKKGPPGSTGMTTPATPIPNERKPKTTKRKLLMVFMINHLTLPDDFIW
ncbi:hypothetical protein [Salinibacillus aidingensis]|uniref:hypothetical protein n=1 Tax=Salinibacillus aidingensis TaxID=237684 RepID=UPI0031CF81C6